MEIWKKVEELEHFSISNYGRLRNDKTNHISHMPNNGKYQTCHLRKNGVYVKKFYIHRLVAQAFIPNPHNYKYVNHKDENCSNNHEDNLEWCTMSYNIKYGTSIDRMMHNRHGKNAPRAVYVDDVYFRSLLLASKYMNCSHRTIRYKLEQGNTEYKGFKIRWA